MIGLLDVHVLVALFDPAHVHHDLAHGWLRNHRSSGWATCPTTENGLVRTLSHPSYPGRRVAVADALERLGAFTGSGEHHFWAGATSLRRASRIDAERLGGHDRVTAAYLLLLAVQNGGRLVTFDRDVPIDAVWRAGPEHAVVLAA